MPLVGVGWAELLLEVERVVWYFVGPVDEVEVEEEDCDFGPLLEVGWIELLLEVSRVVWYFAGPVEEEEE